MPTQRIALKAHHFDDCLNVCEPDVQVAEAFAKMQTLFGQCALEHDRNRTDNDVSAADIERELWRAYVRATVWARMQVLASGLLHEKHLATVASAEGDT